MTWRIAFYVDSVPFTRGVIDGTVSLGGSESACLGLARALARRGHSVTIYATKLDDACVGPDEHGVLWDKAEALPLVNRYFEWDVFVALRMWAPFTIGINARWRMLWNQDLLLPEARAGVMSSAWAYDSIAYVSRFHRQQWETQLPGLAPIGWETKNGYDASLVPANAVKNPNRIIHISRPERGLRPLLQMWPALRSKCPQATLALCRYSSMYDATGWGRVCEAYDAAVAEVHARVGGIEWLGELGKAELYKTIAESSVMWYPGVVDFAETSCIAAIEAQACGTPFVGSHKGALPETVPSGVLIRGDAEHPDYQEASIAAVLDAMDGCARQSVAYRRAQDAGCAHVKGYTYEALAEAWEARFLAQFETRQRAHGKGVLRRLLWEDDHTAALQWASMLPADTETAEAEALCVKVIAGKDHTAADYADHALDTDRELELDTRFKDAAQSFGLRSSLIDIACGNGAAAITFAKVHPTLHVHGLDYAPGNIARARAAAIAHGVADRVTFECLSVWDFERGAPTSEFLEFQASHARAYDALFCGEFIEHVADCSRLVRELEAVCAVGAQVVWTCPSGNGRELLDWDTPLHRGHVHRFATDDLVNVFGAKPHFSLDHLGSVTTPRGREFGNWAVSYTVSGKDDTGQRDYAHRLLTCRPMPTLSVGLMVKNEEYNLGRCLSKLWCLADEIVIGDTGSVDKTCEVAERFHAKVLRLPTVQEHPDGFAGIRNEVMRACSGDWFFWIDADEMLVGGHRLHQYLEGAVFNGYVVRQNHLMLDAATSFDTPVRIFRRQPDIQFYGCVHEQPQQGDCNGDISPTLDITDVQIAHLGYLTEAVRRDKMMGRNLELLKRDVVRFPDRLLGKVLVMRDYVNLAQYEFERAGQVLSPVVKSHLTQAIGIYEKWLSDPGSKLNATARPFYDMALRLVAGATEIEVSLGGRVGGLGQAHAKPERFWARKPEDVVREVEYRLQRVVSQMTPERVQVDPFEAATPSEVPVP